MEDHRFGAKKRRDADERTGWVNGAQLPDENAPQTEDAGPIEEHDGVAGRETEVERPAVVAVDDPPFTGDEPPNGFVPYFARRRLPAGPPIEQVEVDQREARALGEALGEGGLPRSTRADHQHAFHRR